MHKISRFSILTRLSPRMLRHYDKLGILKPAAVDNVNGYRYYTDEQVLDAMEIVRLKRYDFSLDEIKMILKKDDANYFKAKLEAKIDTLDKAMGNQASVMEEMESLLDRCDDQMIQVPQDYAILSGIQPDRIVVKKRDVIAMKNMDDISDRLYSWAIKNGMHPFDLTGTSFLSSFFDEEQTEVEIFIPIKNTGQINKPPPDDQDAAMVSTIVRHRIVSTIHMGRYDGIGAAYLALEKWLSGSEYSLCGHPYEMYLRSTESAVHETDYVTQICYPISDA